MTVKDFLENEDFIFYMLVKESESKKYWDSYLKNHPEDQSSFESAEDAFNKINFSSETLQTNERQLLYNKIFLKSPKHRVIKTRKKRKLIIGMAAMLAFVLFGTYATFKQSKIPEILVEESFSESHIQLITPDKTLSLSNNTVLTVNEAGISNSEGEHLKINDTITYNTLKVPFGKQSQLVLADGTKLWINSGSTVRFPSKFSGQTRTIFLQGEIYLEVSKNELKPFTVETSKFDVQVYGTAFDIKAYANNTDQRVVLVEGSVGVSTPNNMEAMMVPNEYLKITNSELITKTVDTEIYTSWKNGYLLFDDTPLETILFELSRYYNITFSDAQKELTGKVWTGKIYLSAELKDVLETLSILSNSSFKLKESSTPKHTL